MHAIRHQYSLDARAGDRPRARRGAGSTPSRSPTATACRARSFNYGFGAHTDLEWIEAVAETWCKHAKIATLLLPGIGTVHDLKRAYDAGARVVRVATHCTEADISQAAHRIRARSWAWTRSAS